MSPAPEGTFTVSQNVPSGLTDMDNTQSAGYNGFSEKKMNEKLAQEKSSHPIKWTFH